MGFGELAFAVLSVISHLAQVCCRAEHPFSLVWGAESGNTPIAVLVHPFFSCAQKGEAGAIVGGEPC